MAANYITKIGLFSIKVEMAFSLYNISNKDLYSFIELYKNLANDKQIKLYIYTYFLIFKRTHLIKYLKQAI